MNDVVSFLLSNKLQHALLPIKIVFLIFSIIFLFITIYFFFTTSWFKNLIGQDLYEFLTLRAWKSKKTKKEWSKIARRLKTGLESEYKIAILEADSLLGKILGQRGIKGRDIEERLQNIDRDTLPNIEEVLEARQVYNNIVNDPDYKLSQDKAKKTLKVYEDALRNLEEL